MFGGENRRSLVIRYRLREAATVTVSLYKGKNRRVRQLTTGSRARDRTYRIVLKSTSKLSRGSYTLRLTARTPDGRTQTARLSAKHL